MTIEGLYWFVGALLICGALVLYLRNWHREYRQRLTWWQKYGADAKQHVLYLRNWYREYRQRLTWWQQKYDAKQQHDDFMRALGSCADTQGKTQEKIL